jgi:ABC-type Fe3+-hydroxamate transport system substrate-binding protein
MRVRDSLDRELELARPPARIVSLVPSVTETLFVLGVGDTVVGVTDFCIHPEPAVRAKRRVGGTKNPSVRAILELEPDLVIANKEENRRRHVAELEAAGVPVFVTYARTVARALAEIETLGALTGAAASAREIARETRAAQRRAAERAQGNATSVAALVWKEPYMAVGGDTFAHDLLMRCGGTNPFGRSDSRYPRISVADLERAAPDVILLPTEPYAFGERDRCELLRTRCPAARHRRVHVVEGELLSWYGPRMARALDLLSGLLHA